MHSRIDALDLRADLTSEVWMSQKKEYKEPVRDLGEAAFQPPSRLRRA